MVSSSSVAVHFGFLVFIIELWFFAVFMAASSSSLRFVQTERYRTDAGGPDGASPKPAP
jgi:hypothetical protein